MRTIIARFNVTWADLAATVLDIAADSDHVGHVLLVSEANMRGARVGAAATNLQ